ncbi:DOPA-like domain-containing protein [Lentinula aciculospora]|uniref:DOPA-like domain-containing protein n=1 Tax=Lentinula aciculospora TaxID=153920 RepID=A0A9W9A7Q5_9AGAR|nr:DOPA-like domain-containing protein [Lentinula aciculospora]
MDIDTKPSNNLQDVLDAEIKEWHFHIYFAQKNADQNYAALELRDAVLRLRRDGAFVAVPLFRVNTEPMGPHPIGSYEIWAPAETFSSVFSYLCMNRGNLSILVHPLTREEVNPYLFSDHEFRSAWLGPSFPLDLSTLPLRSDEIPLQYPSLRLGYSSASPPMSLDDRRRLGANVENLLKNEKGAARAPSD